MRPGDVVAGRFEIQHLAGRGGMGSVFRAIDRENGEPVAIKVQSEQGEEQSRRWAREAMLLAQLGGPGIVRYIAHAQAPSGELCLMMEWLDGEDLASRLDRHGLTVAESLQVVRRAAEALEPAHARGILHRDIKPSNVFLVGGKIDEVKIIDFGIARVGGATRSRTMLGTPGYVAPEQARGDGRIDARADVFALGCLLFECLTGRPAFSGEHVMALLAKILLEEAPRPSEVRDDLPSELDALVSRMLAKDPAGRPESGAAVVAAIDQLNVTVDLPARRAGRQSPVLTKNEQRLLFVVLVGGNGAMAGDDVQSARRTLDESTDLSPDVAATARAYGGNAAPLADGSTVVTLVGVGSASDPAMNAARCALALRSVVRDVPLVLAMGRGLEGGRLPLGDVIDRGWQLLRASRREAAARRHISIDAALVGLLEGRFELGNTGDTATLLGERLRFERPRKLLGKPTPCVGRERELAELGTVVDDCFGNSVARAVLVTAPAGVGKSRLLHELLSDVHRLARPPQIWLGHGDPMRAGSPFGMLAQLIRGTAGINDASPVELRRARIRGRVGRSVAEQDRDRVSEFLGELAGAPFDAEASVQLRAARSDAALMRDQLARAWADWLRAESELGPILLVLEDVHWGDWPSLRFVDAALRAVRDRPFMVLALARPDVHLQFPGLWIERRVRELRLEDLPRRAAERLVRAVLGEHVRLETVARLTDRAAGTPFYLEELIRAEAEGRGDHPPETVLAMLQARLERLPAETRRVLRAASIFGQSFDRGGVTALCGRDTLVRDALAELDEQELVERSGAGRSAGGEELVFRHALVREAAYLSLTEADRVLGHRLAAQWLEDKGETDAMVLAEHHERGNDGAAAVRWFRRAAEQALEASDLDAVIARAERCVACGARGEELGAVRLLQSEAQLWRGDLASAEDHVVLAMEHLPQGSARWYRAAMGLLMQSANRGHEAQMGRVIAELASAREDERSAAQTMAFALALRLLAMEGRLDSARTFAERLHTIDREMAGDPAITAMVPAGLFYWWSYVDFDPWARKSCAERCARESDLVGHVMNAGMARVHVGWANITLGSFEQAEQVLRDNLELATAGGLGGLIQDFTELQLGTALGQLGRLEEARQLENEAISRLFAAGNWLYGALARLALAEILSRSGELAAAITEAEAASAALARVEPVRVAALALHSRLVLSAGDAAQALAIAELGRKIVTSAERVVDGELELRLALHLALVATGDDERAGHELERASRLLHERASRIPGGPWRERYLHGIAQHAAIIQHSARRTGATS